MVYDLIWKDYIEISVLTLVFYHTACWLQHDQDNKLLNYGIIFLLCALGAYLLELSTLTTLLIWYSPTIAILFALVHQKTLQRNFVALAHTPPLTSAPDNWLEIVISLCLYNMHHVRATHCIVQHRHELSDFIQSSLTLNTPVQQELLTILCESSAYRETEYLWIQTNGIVRGINTTWKTEKEIVLNSLTQTITPHHNSLKQIVMATSATDALVFFLDPLNGLFTVIIGETIFNKISAHHATQLIKKHIASAHKHKGIVNEKINRTSVHQPPS